LWEGNTIRRKEALILGPEEERVWLYFAFLLEEGEKKKERKKRNIDRVFLIPVGEFPPCRARMGILFLKVEKEMPLF